jgi:hypothetical protein
MSHAVEPETSSAGDIDRPTLATAGGREVPLRWLQTWTVLMRNLISVTAALFLVTSRAYPDVQSKFEVAIKFHQRDLSYHAREFDVLHAYKITLIAPNIIEIESRNEGSDSVLRTSTATHRFGEQYVWGQFDGHDLMAVWHIINPHEIQQIYKYPNFVRTIDVYFSREKCKATMLFKLNAGETTFKFPTIASDYKKWDDYDDVYFVEGVCHIVRETENQNR